MEAYYKEELPATPEERSSFVQDVLRMGLERLMEEAKTRGFVDSPYGRLGEPTPIMNEEDFLSTKEDPNDEPVFNFEYGFNHVRYLADFIKQFHPEAVIERRKLREEEERLKRAAELHEKRQDKVCAELASLAKGMNSGIVSGPIVVPVNSSSVNVLCRAVESGTIILEMSRNPEVWDSDYVHGGIADVDASCGYTSTMLVDGLEGGVRYYVRACLLSAAVKEGVVQDLDRTGPEKAFLGREGEAFQTMEFVSLPLLEPKAVTTHHPETGLPLPDEEIVAQEEAARPRSFTLVGMALPAPSAEMAQFALNGFESPTVPLSTLTGEADGAALTCILGDVFPRGKASQGVDSAWFQRQGATFHLGRSVMLGSNLAPHQSGVVVAWNDCQTGSDVALSAEEIIYRQYNSDLKTFKKKMAKIEDKRKHKKKVDPKDVPTEPVLSRPPENLAFNTLVENTIPMIPNVDSTRNCYRTFKVSKALQVWVLDMRCGFIGKAQSRWLKDTLSRSRSDWKVVLCGTPYGIRPVATVAQSRGSSTRGVTHSTDRPDDIGSYGFSTVSLPHVLASIQAERRDKELAGEEEEGEEDKAQGQVEMQTEDTLSLSVEPELSAALATPELSHSDADVEVPVPVPEHALVVERADGRIALPSGIVLLTGGGQTPYVAVYDPVCTGTPFAMEVCAGQAVAPAAIAGAESSSGSDEGAVAGVSLDTRLKSSLLYCGKEGGMSVATLKHNPDNTLVVSLVDGGGGAMWSRTFVLDEGE